MSKLGLRFLEELALDFLLLLCPLMKFKIGDIMLWISHLFGQSEFSFLIVPAN